MFEKLRYKPACYMVVGLVNGMMEAHAWLVGNRLA